MRGVPSRLTAVDADFADDAYSTVPKIRVIRVIRFLRGSFSPRV